MQDQSFWDAAQFRFARQLAWLMPEKEDPDKEEPERTTPPPPTATPAYDRANVQGGILRSYDNISHGRLLLIAFDGSAAAAAFLGRLIPQVTRDDQELSSGELVTNVAFTYEGLRAVGLNETQLAWFPQEFREGMEARASVLGDLRMNHPRRWRLPERREPIPEDGEPARIELSTVHLVVQMRTGPAPKDAEQSSTPDQRLDSQVGSLLKGLDGVHLLSVQPMCRYGSTLTQAVREFVNDHRKAGTRPTGPDKRTPARIGVAVFGSFDDPARDDEVARTLVGALMGFLPTVDGNLRLSLNEWLRDGSFWSLRTAMATPDPVTPTPDMATPYAKAKKLLRGPLVRAMQLRPSPELVWRTATRHHTIGRGEVPVVPDDKVVLSIVSATQQCLERGDPDIFPVFGGDRLADPRPVHACPGYGAGMGVMLGILSALLEVKEAMRPSPAPLAFTLEGPIPPGIQTMNLL